MAECVSTRNDHVCRQYQLLVKVDGWEEVEVGTLPLITERISIEGAGDDQSDAFLVNAAASLVNRGWIACLDNHGAAIPDGAWSFGEREDDDTFVITEKSSDLITRIVREGKKNWLESEDHIPRMLKWMLPVDLRFKDGVCCMLNSVCNWASTRNVLISMGVPHVIPSASAFRVKDALVLPFNFRVTPAGNTEISEAYDLARNMLASKAAALIPDAGSLAHLAHFHERVRCNPAAFHNQAEYLVGSANFISGIKGLGVAGRLGAWATAFMPDAYIPGWVEGFRSESDYDLAFEEGCKLLAKARKEATDRMCNMVSSPEGLSAPKYQEICTKFGIAVNRSVCRALGECESSDTE